MSNPAQIADTIRTQALELIKHSQDATVQATRTWANIVIQSAPEPLNAAGVAARLPDPTRVTDQVFEFTGQLLATQREFVTALAGAVKPVNDATTGTKTKK